MSESAPQPRDAIVAAVAQALADIYFREVCEEKQTAEQLLQTAQRMRALHEAILTARDLLGILDKAAEAGRTTAAAEAGVVVLPEIIDAKLTDS